MTGGVARGDLEYRISRHSTLGADYRYTYYDYTKGFGNIEYQLGGHQLQHPILAARAAFRAHRRRARGEPSLTEVTLDPAIAALLGETEAIQAAYRLKLRARHAGAPDGHFPPVAVYAGISRPGSSGQWRLPHLAGTIPATASYSYTGVRHWNFGVNGTYGRMTALVQTIGAYTTYGGGIGVTRDLGRGLACRDCAWTRATTISPGTTTVHAYRDTASSSG